MKLIDGRARHLKLPLSLFHIVEPLGTSATVAAMGGSTRPTTDTRKRRYLPARVQTLPIPIVFRLSVHRRLVRRLGGSAKTLSGSGRGEMPEISNSQLNQVQPQVNPRDLRNALWHPPNTKPSVADVAFVTRRSGEPNPRLGRMGKLDHTCNQDTRGLFDS